VATCGSVPLARAALRARPGRGQVWDWGRREAGREDKGYNRLFACLLIKNEYNKRCNVLHQITMVLECVVAKTSFFSGLEQKPSFFNVL